MRSSRNLGRATGFAVAALVLMAGDVAYALDAGPVSSIETIVFIRHGEKPEQGLGQLNCKGLNRALALPAVIEAKFGKPDALFAANPSKRKDDNGTPYDYIRPLATIEPTAVKFGLPVDTTYGFAEARELQDALEQPKLRGSRVVVAWEHHLIDVIVKQLMTAHGGSKDDVPKWQSSDFDSIYVVAITWTGDKSSIEFRRDTQGLNGQPDSCPR